MTPEQFAEFLAQTKQVAYTMQLIAWVLAIGFVMLWIKGDK